MNDLNFVLMDILTFPKKNSKDLVRIAILLENTQYHIIRVFLTEDTYKSLKEVPSGTVVTDRVSFLYKPDISGYQLYLK